MAVEEVIHKTKPSANLGRSPIERPLLNFVVGFDMSCMTHELNNGPSTSSQKNVKDLVSILGVVSVIQE